MKILLTGANGFIGQALLPELVTRGHEIVLLSRKSLTPLPETVSEIVAATSDWPKAVSGKPFDVCIHLAWIATPGIYLESPDNEMLAEVTIALAESLFQSGLPHLIALGTCIEYAPGPVAPCAEARTPVAPPSTYGQAKDRARSGVAAAATRHGSGYTWARLFYPYGAGEHPNRIPSSFLRTLRQNQPLSLKTSDSIKDWIEIRDVVSAIVHLAETEQPQSEINLGTGIGTRIGDLAKLAARITGSDPALVRSAENPASDPYAYHVADITKLTSTGWAPKISLETGMLRLNQTL